MRVFPEVLTPVLREFRLCDIYPVTVVVNDESGLVKLWISLLFLDGFYSPVLSEIYYIITDVWSLYSLSCELQLLKLTGESSFSLTLIL